MPERLVCPKCGIVLPSNTASNCPECDADLGLPETVRGGYEPSATGVGTAVRYFGDYELLEEIARGGMGVVYKARQVSLNRSVALKMILAGQLADDEAVQRFQTEAEAAANLDHPGIVPIHEVGEHQGQHYFSMGFVEGTSLAARVAEGPLAPKEAAELVKTVTEAVAYAHAQGVIHRDLKPANILLDQNGEPRITDFGLAKRTDIDSDLTSTGQILGTPGYMPPEQATGEINRISEASDVYSLGAVLYCLLTGRPPFQAANVMDTLMQVVQKDPVSPRQLNAAVPIDLETLCLKCLEKDPRRRYQPAGALADELQRFLDNKPIQARPLSRPARAWRWCQRNPVVAALSAAVVLALVIGTGVSTFYAIHATQQADVARRRLRMSELGAYNLQLARVRDIWRREPQRALQLLHDTDVCPQRLRDFTWGLYHRACRPQLRTLEGHVDRLRQVVFSPDGTTLASASDDNTIKIWNVAEGKLRQTLTGHTRNVVWAGFSADERTLISAGEDGTVRVWNAESGELRATIEQVNVPRAITTEEVNVPSLALSPDDRTLAAASDDGTIQLWSLADRRKLATLAGHKGWVRCLAFSPDGKTLASAGDNRRVKLWDLATNEQRRELMGHDDTVRFVVFSEGGKSLISVGRKGTIEVWNPNTGQKRTTLTRGESNTSLAALSPRGNILAVGSAATIDLWDINNGQFLATLAEEWQRIECLAFSPGGNILAVGSSENKDVNWATIKLFSAVGDESSAVLRGHTGFVTQLATSPDGKMVASAGIEGEEIESEYMAVRFWDARSGQSMGSLPRYGEDSNLIDGLAFSPDGKTLATARASSRGGIIELWDIETRRQRVTIDAHNVKSVAFSPDGTKLASAGYDRAPQNGEDSDRPWSLKIWDVATGKHLTTLKKGPEIITCLAYSPDGKMLALGISQPGQDRIGDFITLLDAASGQEMAILKGDLNFLEFLAFSPDGKTLASGSEQTITLWDVASSQVRDTLSGSNEKDVVKCLAYSPDGKTLASTGGVPFDEVAGRTIKLWDAVTGQERATLSGHDKFVNHVEFSQDGRMLASASWDGTVRLWKADGSETPAPGEELEGTYVIPVAWSSDGRKLTLAKDKLRSDANSREADDTSTEDRYMREIQQWDVVTGKRLGGLPANDESLLFASPDGNTLATRSDDGTIRIWNTANWQQTAALRPDGDIRDHLFSPDGKTLLLEVDEEFELWNTVSGQRTAVLNPDGHAWDPFFSSDGKTLVWNVDGNIQLCDATTGTTQTFAVGDPEQASKEGAYRRCQQVVYSLNGMSLAAAVDNNVKLLDVATLAVKAILPGHDSGVEAIIFSPNGKTIASASGDSLWIWKAATGDRLATVNAESQGDELSPLGYSPDGSLLAYLEDSDRVKLWDVAASQVRAEFSGTMTFFMSGFSPAALRGIVDFSPDGKTFAVAGSQLGTIVLWDLTDHTERLKLAGHTDYVLAVEFSHDGKTLVSASADNTVRLWDAITGEEKFRLAIQPALVHRLALSPGGETIASTSKRTIQLWDTATEEQRATLKHPLPLGYSAPRQAVSALTFSSSGKTLASLDTESDYATLWDTTSGEKLIELTGIRDQKWVAFAPDGDTLAAIGDKTVGLWNAATGEQLTSASFQVDRSVGSYALSPNGQWLAVGLGQETIKLFNVRTSEERTLSGRQGCSEGLLFSPDSETLVSGSEQLYLWDVTTATQRAELIGHTERVIAMALSPDGQTLVTGGYDETVRLWDVATGDPRSVLLGHTGVVGSIDFSPDSTCLTSICSNGLVKRWDASNGKELATLTVARDRHYLLSPDGKLLIDVDRDNAVNVLDMTTGKQRSLAKP